MRLETLNENESKTKFEFSVKPFLEISENESKTKFELNERNFLVDSEA